MMTDEGLREFYAAMLRDIAQYDLFKLELINEPLIGFPPYYTKLDQNNGMVTVYMTRELMSIYQCVEGDMLLDFPDFLD